MALRMISSFNTSEIVASGVIANKYGGKVIYLNGPNKSRLLFQLPPLKAIVGVKESELNPGTYSMPLSVDNEGVLKAFQTLEGYVLDLIAANSVELMGKKMTREVIEAGDSWKPLLKMPKKEGYAPLLSLKPWFDKTTLKTEAYTSDREPCDLFTLEKGQRVSVILEISQIWRSPLGVGVSVRLHKVMFAPTQKLAGCAFLAEADVPVADSDEGSETVSVADSDE